VIRLATIVTAALLAAQPPLFRSSIEVVRLDVSVTRSGIPVRGLTAHDFVLTDNGAAQTVESVRLEELPLSVTLVLDTSASVSGDRLVHLIQAGSELTAALRPDDRASLITFSHAVNLRVTMTHDFSRINTALAQLNGVGATSLRDAVHLAIELAPRDATRPLLLVFTDGHDTSSWLSEEAVLDTTRRTGVVIHVVRVESDAFLDKLTDASGGRTWSATSDRQLRALFTRALEEMRARYLLTYTPAGVKRPGWHDIKVRLNGGRAAITTRPGYFVGEE
jgi:VWFA-related protein